MSTYLKIKVKPDTSSVVSGQTAIVNAVNLGGVGLFKQRTGSNLEFKGLAGNNISFINNTTGVTISLNTGLTGNFLLNGKIAIGNYVPPAGYKLSINDISAGPIPTAMQVGNAAGSTVYGIDGNGNGYLYNNASGRDFNLINAGGYVARMNADGSFQLYNRLNLGTPNISVTSTKLQVRANGNSQSSRWGYIEDSSGGGLISFYDDGSIGVTSPSIGPFYKLYSVGGISTKFQSFDGAGGYGFVGTETENDFIVGTNNTARIRVNATTGKVSLSNLLNLASTTNASPSTGDIWREGDVLKFQTSTGTKTITLS